MLKDEDDEDDEDDEEDEEDEEAGGCTGEATLVAADESPTRLPAAAETSAEPWSARGVATAFVFWALGRVLRSAVSAFVLSPVSR